MIALLPVSRFSVTYQTTSGRPYSKLESLSLRAIAEGCGSVEELAEKFAIHPRLATECLVTLIQAGWVAVGGVGGAGYQLTAEGRAAVKGETLPPQHILWPGQTSWLVMERLTGMVIPNNEIEFHNKSRLQDWGIWETSVRLPLLYTADRIDEGQLRPVLRIEQGHWLSGVGEIKIRSKFNHFAPINVDPDASEVALPIRWKGHLDVLIMKYVLASPLAADEGYVATRWAGAGRKWRLDGESNVRERGATRESPWPDDLDQNRLITTVAGHQEHLRHVLRNARRNVLIASSVSIGSALESLLDDLRSALERGVHIDVLWSDDEAGPTVLKLLKKLQYDFRNLPGALAFSREAADAAAHVLVWDDADGVRAAVASHSWLVGDGSGNGGCCGAAVVVANPHAVSALAHSIAGIWAEVPSERLASAPGRWRRVSIALDEAAALSPATSQPYAASCGIRLLRGSEHETAFENLLVGSERLLIASQELEPASLEHVIEVRATRSPRSAGGARSDLLILVPGESAAPNDIRSRCEAASIRVVEWPALRGAFVVGEETVIVGGRDFLASDARGSAIRRQVSLEVDGAEFAALAWDAIGVGAVGSSVLSRRSN